jgi:hypothetical protein
MKRVERPGAPARVEGRPDVLYALRNMPLARFSTTASRATDPTKHPLARMANILTGAQIAGVDTAREAQLRIRDRLIERLKELEWEGKVTSPEYWRPTGAGSDDPEVQALLAQLRAYQNAAARQQRAAAKAGGR